MKALTVWQPWASLIAIGAKPYEFRGWKPPRSIIGQRIAIHAGARRMRPTEIRELLVRLGDRHEPPCVHADLARPRLERSLQGLADRGAPLFRGEPPFHLPLSAVICTAIVGTPKRGDECAAEFGAAATNDSDREGTFNWGWPMLDIEPVMPPIETRGAQGLWDFRP